MDLLLLGIISTWMFFVVIWEQTHYFLFTIFNAMPMLGSIFLMIHLRRLHEVVEVLRDGDLLDITILLAVWALHIFSGHDHSREMSQIVSQLHVHACSRVRLRVILSIRSDLIDIEQELRTSTRQQASISWRSNDCLPMTASRARRWIWWIWKIADIYTIYTSSRRLAHIWSTFEGKVRCTPYVCPPCRPY